MCSSDLTGIRNLGRKLAAEFAGNPIEVTILISHTHWDHIQGFPFFGPMYRPDARLRVVGPAQENLDVQSLFAGQMGPIYFPVPFEAIAANMSFEHLNEGSWSADGATVSAMRVRHPSFAVGYRMDAGGRSICYIPDNELSGGSHVTASGWRDRLIESDDAVQDWIAQHPATDTQQLRRPISSHVPSTRNPPGDNRALIVAHARRTSDSPYWRSTFAARIRTGLRSSKGTSKPP